MARFSMIEVATQFDAKRAMWSKSSTEKMLAANYVQMGHLLDAQEKSNELQQCSIAIQSRLCSLAVRTNGLLSDMSSTLESLKESLTRTEDILSQSLAVQKDHLMLDKRERVLKDALFRWTEILSNSAGLSDPQWVLIASRTLLAFLKSWEFTTQDLQDAAEKKAFLDLTKRANTFVKESDKATVLEVDMFQSLYAEYHELLDPAVRTEIESREFQQTAFDPSPDIKVISALVEKHFGSTYQGQIVTFWQSLPLTHPHCSPTLSDKSQTSFIAAEADRAAAGGETPLVGVYAVRTPASYLSLEHFSRNSACLLLTSHGIRQYWNPPLRNQWMLGMKYQEDAKSYLELGEGNTTVFDDMLLSPDMQPIVEKSKAFVTDMVAFWGQHQQACEKAQSQHHDSQETARQEWQKAKDDELLSLQNKLSTGKARINEYLDLHPAVEEFYARV